MKVAAVCCQVPSWQVPEGWGKAWINTADIPAEIRIVWDALPLEPACSLEKLLKNAGWKREHSRFSSIGRLVRSTKTWGGCIKELRNLYNLVSKQRARGSAVGWGTMLQAGRSRIRVPTRWIFFNLSNPSGSTVILESTQSLTEMSIRNLLGGKGRPARKADNLTAISELTVYRKCGSLDVSQPYGSSRSNTKIALSEHFVRAEDCERFRWAVNVASMGA
jgi:hypothetical protein